MNKKKNKPPKNDLSHLDLDTVNAISSTDCTGLIPSAPATQTELESYKDMYEFNKKQKDVK